MRTTLSFFVLPSLIGCAPTAYSYSGYWASKHFPITPAEWTYSNETEDYGMKVTVVSTEQENGTTVASFDYLNSDEDDALLYSIKWSSDDNNGIQVHGYALDDGSWVNFSSPVQIAERQVEPGDISETTVDNHSYVADFETYEDCKNVSAQSWTCMKVVISSDEANPAPFLGTWHWATEYGTSIFQPVDAETPWKLVTHELILE